MRQTNSKCSYIAARCRSHVFLEKSPAKCPDRQYWWEWLTAAYFMRLFRSGLQQAQPSRLRRALEPNLLFLRSVFVMSTGPTPSLFGKASAHFKFRNLLIPEAFERLRKPNPAFGHILTRTFYLMAFTRLTDFFEKISFFPTGCFQSGKSALDLRPYGFVLIRQFKRTA